MEKLLPRLIRASAGTGKTFDLSSRYISLLAMGEKPDKILATTFTRKAAFEIEERIFQRLAQAGLDSKAAKEISASIGDPEFSSSKARGLLTKLVRQQHRLNISTLDSFFFGIAAAFSLELGLMPGWQPADPDTERDVLREALRSLFEHSDVREIVNLMQSMHGGYTNRSVHERIERNLEGTFDLYRGSSENAWSNLRVNKGITSEQIKEAILGLKTFEVPRTKAGAPNKIWQRSIDNDLQKVENELWEDFLKGKLPASILDGLGEYNRAAIPKGIQEIYLLLLKHASATILGRLRAQSEATYKLMNGFEVEYEKQRKLRQSLSFSDVKKKLSDAALTGALDELYYRLDSRLSHLLLDEFQDTSNEEWRVIEPIVDEILSKGDLDYSFFCVGDAKQAIYGWRGGVAEIFDSLERKWPQLIPESKDASYRCSVSVIEFINRVFSSLASLEALEERADAVLEWQERFHPHRAIREGSKGYVRCEFLRNDPEEETENLILDRVVQLAEALKIEAPKAQIGILVRRNKDVADIITALGHAGIAASEEGGTALVDSPIICAVLSLLKLSEHPGDRVARYHVSISPLGEIFKFKDRDNTALLSARLRKEILDQGYGAFLSKIADQVSKFCTHRDKRRMSQLVELGILFERRRSARVSDFLRMVQSSRVEDPSAEQIRVMTIHQAKGLEFDIVIAPFIHSAMYRYAADSLLSVSDSPTEKPKQIVRGVNKRNMRLSPELTRLYVEDQSRKCREALSILYVALSRAKSMLFVIGKEEDTNKKLNYSAMLRQALGEDVVEGISELYAELGDLKESLEEYGRGDSGEARKAPDEEKETSIKINVSKAPVCQHVKLSDFKLGTFEQLSEKLVLSSDKERVRDRIMHAFISCIEWLEDFKPSNEKLENLGRKVTGKEKLIETCVEAFLRLIKKQAAQNVFCREAQALKNGSLVEVLRNFPFVFKDDSVIYTGSFDRVVLHIRDDKIECVDLYAFRADTLFPGDLGAGALDINRQQLEVLKKAAMATFKLGQNKVNSRIMWTESGKLEELAQ